VIACSVDLGGIDDHCCLEVISTKINRKNNHL
jgi:hypothetical protein